MDGGLSLLDGSCRVVFDPFGVCVIVITVSHLSSVGCTCTATNAAGDFLSLALSLSLSPLARSSAICMETKRCLRMVSFCVNIVLNYYYNNLKLDRCAKTHIIFLIEYTGYKIV